MTIAAAGFVLNAAKLAVAGGAPTGVYAAVWFPSDYWYVSILLMLFSSPHAWTEPRALFHLSCSACMLAFEVSAAATASATALLGWSRGMSMAGAYGRYLTKAGPLSGPGDLLLELLSPMTMSLGFRMFGEPDRSQPACHTLTGPHSSVY